MADATTTRVRERWSVARLARRNAVLAPAARARDASAAEVARVGAPAVRRARRRAQVLLPDADGALVAGIVVVAESGRREDAGRAAVGALGTARRRAAIAERAWIARAAEVALARGRAQAAREQAHLPRRAVGVCAARPGSARAAVGGAARAVRRPARRTRSAAAPRPLAGRAVIGHDGVAATSHERDSERRSASEQGLHRPSSIASFLFPVSCSADDTVACWSDTRHP